MNIIVWFFTETIFGIAAITAAIYSVTKILHNKINKFPEPALISGLAFFLLLMTLPSYPRYKFEKETIEQFEKNKHFRLVNSAKWGDMIEPVTWFNTPIGFFQFVSPDPSTYSAKVGGSFKSVILRYGEEPIQQLIDVDCELGEISVSEPDEEGVLRITSRFGDKMTKQEIEIYCENNFEKEADLVRNLVLQN